MRANRLLVPTSKTLAMSATWQVRSPAPVAPGEGVCFVGTRFTERVFR